MNPLFTTVLELDAALGGDAQLILGGGLGLYLRQEHFRKTAQRTLLPFDRLPQARTTQDIDLFLRAEVIADPDAVMKYRNALDALGFEVVPSAAWLKFTRNVGGSEVLLDVMVGPLGKHTNRVSVNDSRVRPLTLSGKDGLHAFATEEAVGIERSPQPLMLHGTNGQGQPASCQVLIPRAFPYALMKLGALRDRIHDANKQDGRHHAMDLYRIIGLLTEEEVAASAILARAFAHDPEIAAALTTIDTLLAPPNGLGRIRLLEYQRLNQDTVPAVNPDLLVTELRQLLSSVPPV